jgi:hypothetical protein
MMRKVVILLSILVVLAGVVVSGSYAQQAEKCDMCGKPVTPTTKVVIEYVDKTEVYCCPHCALMALIVRKLDLDSPQIKAVTVTDYNTKSPLDPSKAFFTYGGTDVPCCAPPIIAFTERSDAEEHVERFGGEVLTWRGCFEKFSKEL